MEPNQPAPVQNTAPLSTTIDQGGATLGTGGGVVPNQTTTEGGNPSQAAKPAKPESLSDTLRSELARAQSEDDGEKSADKQTDAKPAAKAPDKDAGKDAEAKPERVRSEDGKFSRPVAQEAREPSEANQTNQTNQANDGREAKDGVRHEAPQRFLPRAKELWGNVPTVVKAEITRMTADHEAELSRSREVSERYESLRQYDEIARSNGRDLKDSLAKIVNIEHTMASNPIAGIAAILQEVGPVKSDGTRINLMDILQYISSTEGAYEQALARAPRPAEQQASNEIAALKQEIQSMRLEQTAQSVILPFAAQNPRYQELEADIAFFLHSGKIPASLTPQEKLEVAYDMAVRINPTSGVEPTRQTAALATRPAPSDDAGARSIRGAPNGQEPDDDSHDDSTDIRALLRKEMRKAS